MLQYWIEKFTSKHAVKPLFTTMLEGWLKIAIVAEILAKYHLQDLTQTMFEYIA
jgi:hypothetical protein